MDLRLNTKNQLDLKIEDIPGLKELLINSGANVNAVLDPVRTAIIYLDNKAQELQQQADNLQAEASIIKRVLGELSKRVFDKKELELEIRTAKTQIFSLPNSIGKNYELFYNGVLQMPNTYEVNNKTLTLKTSFDGDFIVGEDRLLLRYYINK